MFDVPDHPVIRNMEATGYPDGRGPRLCGRCSECGEDINEGDFYYRLGGNDYCERCVNGAFTEAEY